MRDRQAAAAASAGSSDATIYDLATTGLPARIDAGSRVLDLGCGAGAFGRYLRTRSLAALLDGMDLLRYADWPAEVYRTFHQTDLDAEFAETIEDRYDFIFANEVIHSLENPRAFVRQAARLLAPGGVLVVTTANPLCLPSIALLLTRGTSRNFLEGPSRYPSQITPLLPVDAERIVREAGLDCVSLDFSGRCRLRGGLHFQTWLPFLGGRFFSDHYRVVASSSSAARR
jgi:2-polyprenyl-3-methyl-5-hydroxy-6-metoxy-1,4-benzoquinol methylase